MKRSVVLVVGFAFLLAASFALAEAPRKELPAKTEHRMIHKTVMGKVAEITDTSLKLTRTVKGKEETMEFTLDKPLTGISAGDEVKVLFHEKNGENILMAAHKKEPVKAMASTQKKLAPTERKQAPVVK
jgi:hypothetical protein